MRSFSLVTRMNTLCRENSPVSTVYMCEKHQLFLHYSSKYNCVCHVGLSSRITSDLHLEILAKTVIPGYNVVGTSKCILSQAGRLSQLPIIAFKKRT